MIKNLKPLLLIFSLLYIPFVSALDIGEMAPNWQLKNGYDENIDFYGDSSNKVAVLIYWASWCPYCATLMPHLQEVANQYNENDDVVFYAMNINETEDPKRHMQEQRYTFELIMNADPTMDGYGVRGTPNVLVIDKQNKVIFRRLPDTPNIEVKDAVQGAIATALN